MVYLQVNGNLFSVDCIFFVDSNCHLFINECDISSYIILLNCHAQHISTHIVIQMGRSGGGGAWILHIYICMSDHVSRMKVAFSFFKMNYLKAYSSKTLLIA